MTRDRAWLQAYVATHRENARVTAAGEAFETAGREETQRKTRPEVTQSSEKPPRAVKVSTNTAQIPQVAFKALPENNGSHLEQAALQIIRTSNLPDPTREHKFHSVRKWKFDFAWPDLKLALEVEGGLYGKSRHTSLSGYSADCEKYTIAALLGWRVMRCTTIHIKNGDLRKWLEIASLGAQ